MGWPMLAFGSGAAIDMSDLHRGGFVKRAEYHAPAERALECGVFAAGAALKGRFRDPRGERIIELLALDQCLGLPRPPRNCGHAAECDPGVANRAVLYVERDRGRRQREF